MTSKEFKFLEIINNTINSKYLGDDCAYLEEYNLALSSDSLIEDVHFSTLFMSAYEIAQKALLVNISDILASGAKPKYALVNLSGKLDETFIKEFYLGLNDVAKTYGVQIIGGDLTKADKINISITIIGDYKNRTPSKRSNAKNGYIVATAGIFGSSAQGLEDLKNGIKDNEFIQIHKKPKLYPEISEKISKNIKNSYAMMDSSDSLFDCLYQISNKSGVRIDIDFNKIPAKTTNKDFVLYGGEDYCLVVCLNEEDFNNIKGLTKIGICSSGCGVYIDNCKLDYKGYTHFD